MKEANTPGVGLVLNETLLSYIPEAHNYLLYQDQRFDVTGIAPAEQSPFDVLLSEVAIRPQQIGDWKVHFHQNYLQAWLQKEGLAYSLDEIWAIREKCIAALSSHPSN